MKVAMNYFPHYLIRPLVLWKTSRDSQKEAGGGGVTWDGDEEEETGGFAGPLVPPSPSPWF